MSEKTSKKKKKAVYTPVHTVFTLIIIFLLILAMIVVGRKAYDYGYRVFTEGAFEKPPGRDVLVRVQEDTSELELGKILEERGLVRDGDLFSLQLRLSVYHKKINPGEYALNSSMTPKEMMAIMAKKEEDSTEGASQ